MHAMVAFLYYPPRYVERLTQDVLKQLSQKSMENREPRVQPV